MKRGASVKAEGVEVDSDVVDTDGSSAGALKRLRRGDECIAAGAGAGGVMASASSGARGAAVVVKAGTCTALHTCPSSSALHHLLPLSAAVSSSLPYTKSDVYTPTNFPTHAPSRPCVHNVHVHSTKQTRTMFMHLAVAFVVLRYRADRSRCCSCVVGRRWRSCCPY